ncbi:helix-turn-helix domain-containing protein [Pleurocapsa sp. PCC 7319]|uniref:helix-turn-helix domain-containing protein n=1 Tax=Pleurocapsa sp. PCC 7319 TaxID=118161 RepID=UPI000348755C|nr:AraC family transcriptional regulator [Pleurocapsa sp. PCC 7319]
MMSFKVREVAVCDTQKLNHTVYQFDKFSFYNSLEQSSHWAGHNHQEIQITLPQVNAKAWIEYQPSIGRHHTKQIKFGQAFLVSPNQFHALDWQQTAELTLFYLAPSFLEGAIDDSLESNHLEICDRFSLVDDTLIREVGVIFRYLSSCGAGEDKLYLESLANLLAVHLLKNYLNYSLEISHCHKKLSQKKLNLVLDYIEANLDQKITLANLAKMAGVGKFYFCRLFKSSINLTPYQYVLQQRVERAKKLLENSDLAICDIALECGFSSQSHLAKHFRALVDESPLNYRKSFK